MLCLFSSPGALCSAHCAIVITHCLSVSVASTDINKSAPNLVKREMTIRSWIFLIMELIGLELSRLSLSSLELENLPYFTLFTL